MNSNSNEVSSSVDVALKPFSTASFSLFQMSYLAQFWGLGLGLDLKKSIKKVQKGSLKYEKPIVGSDRNAKMLFEPLRVQN